MPPRKRAVSTPRIPHTDSCGAPERVESFPVLDSSGAPRTVRRCLECGTQEIE